jgi:diguanylate cyclase (GGDEF)-like protein
MRARVFSRPSARATSATAKENLVPDDRALEVLTRSAVALAHDGTIEPALEELLAAVTKAVGAGSGAIFAQDPDRPAIELIASVGFDEASLAAFAKTVADNPDHAVRRTIADRVVTFDATPMAPGATGLRSHLPLVVTRDAVDLPLGVLAVAHDAPLDEESRRLLTAAAQLAAVGIDRARLSSLVAERSEWFERMAHMDPLTGLANTRTFSRVLELELARAGRQGGEVSLAVFDIDDFRSTNEAAGAAVGDDILREVAAVLAESVRLVDTVARYGGDEFVLVAPGSAGLTVARRVLAGVAALPEVAGRQVSISAGVATFPADAGTAEELLAAAERALAEARASGSGTLGEARSQRAR